MPITATRLPARSAEWSQRRSGRGRRGSRSARRCRAAAARQSAPAPITRVCERTTLARRRTHPLAGVVVPARVLEPGVEDEAVQDAGARARRAGGRRGSRAAPRRRRSSRGSGRRRRSRGGWGRRRPRRGSVLSRQVPPTSPAFSTTRKSVSPSSCSLIAAHRPAKPAPTTRCFRHAWGRTDGSDRTHY